MNTLLVRTSAVAAAALAAAGLAVGLAPAASAAATGGTTTLTVTTSYAGSAAVGGVLVAPAGGASVSYDSAANGLDYQFPVTGGDANVDNFTGQLEHRGSLVFVDYRTFKTVTVSNIELDYITNTVTGQLPGSAGQTALFDLDGYGSSTSTATSQSYTASSLDWDAAGAAALDTALHTSFFSAGDTVGSFATSYTVDGS